MDRRMLLPLGVALLLGCAPFDVHHDYDRSAAFQDLKTWRWATATQGRDWERLQRENLMARRVAAEVERVLLARGFARAGEGKPDFLVAVTPLQRVRHWTTVSGFRGMGWAETRTYVDSGLQVEILEPGSRRVIWTAQGATGVQAGDTPEVAEARIAAAVKALLADFPPGRRGRA